MKATKIFNAKHIVLISTLAQTLVVSFALAVPGTEVAKRSFIGMPCENTTDCKGDNLHCVEEKRSKNASRFPGGYCVKFDCSETSPCDVGSTCVTAEKLDFNVCLAACTDDTHCRNGYECHEGGVCLPL